MVLSPYDQQVYDAGFKFVPQTQYLLNPFQIPQSGGGGSAPPGPVQPGLPSINIGGGGGGGGFNPYNPDMSQIRTDFNPRAYNLAMRQGNTVGPNPDLFYAPQSKIGALTDFIPGIGVIKRGAEFLKGLMPINERAIMENEARAAGIFTDDIGRIVAGPGGYNPAQGIMAGYNLSGIDSSTFDKRRATIQKTIEKKKARGEDTSVLENRLDLLDEAEEDILNLQKRTDTIYKYRKKKKEAEAAASKTTDDTAITDTTKPDQTGTLPPNNDPRQDHDGDGIPNNVELAGGSYDGGYQAAEGGFEFTGSQPGTSDLGYTDSGPFTGLARGGRVYFMDGGIVDLVDIYD